MVAVEKNEVGQKIRELRKKANLTQQELAGMIGIKQSNLSRMENQSDMQIYQSSTTSPVRP